MTEDRNTEPLGSNLSTSETLVWLMSLKLVPRMDRFAIRCTDILFFDTYA